VVRPPRRPVAAAVATTDLPGVSFSTFLDVALYGPDGFYERGGAPGRRGDFLTSPEVGPLFAEVLLRAIDSWCDAPCRVIEVGAGPGTLARHLLGLRPDLDLVLVERSAAFRARHAELPVRSRADLPPSPLTGVVIANELLDNLPFDLLERRGGAWVEVRVDAGEERLVPAADADAALAQRLAPGAVDGARIPLQRAAAAFVADTLARMAGGRLVLIDYADTTVSLAARPWGDWVRTYRSHQRGGHPLDSPGSQDITCEVAVDQLVPAPTLDRSQADFLRVHGIDQLREAALTAWQERAHIGDLAALRSRSRVHEADALTDPAGLGGFRVLEWVVP
jgi:SAM-dependent MidA family methyltransferase